MLGVLIFSGAIKLGGGSSTTSASGGIIKIWGTVPRKDISQAIAFLNSQNKTTKIVYEEKDARTYKDDLLNAFAFGGVPDLFLLSQDLLFTYEDKIITIPYTYFPEKTFDDTYIRAASIFKKTGGFLGFPLLVDPLITYYNQDLLETAGFAQPPKYWSDLFTYVPKLTQKNDALQISKSGVALGEFSNIQNAKKIFVGLLLQLNNSIIYLNEKGDYVSRLTEASNVSSKPAIQSMNFYNEFSDPVKDVYSWNKSLKNSEDDFVSGDLALYFGLASEYRKIKLKNPNLNFDIGPLPQVQELNNSITYADIYALAIPKNSPNAQLSLSLAASLANGANTGSVVASAGFAPARRDLIAAKRAAPYMDVFYDSALVSRSWIDPNDEATNNIFTKMFDDVVSGLKKPEDAVKDADTEIRALLLSKRGR